MLNQPAPLPIQVPAIPPPPVASSRIAVEQALLGQAMKVLREGHDAPTALALLAQHAERFPEGALASEASMVRVEALLALGRRSEALSALDGIALASLPNRDERFVARGELRATDGRWSEAQQDFDQALRSHNLPATSTKARNIQERALWGRAAARSRLGDQAGARADLELYLRHYPSGKFAGPASSLLKGVP
jgi:TolA-binding protein